MMRLCSVTMPHRSATARNRFSVVREWFCHRKGLPKTRGPLDEAMKVVLTYFSTV